MSCLYINTNVYRLVTIKTVHKMQMIYFLHLIGSLSNIAHNV